MSLLNTVFAEIFKCTVFASIRLQLDVQEMNVTSVNVTFVGRDQESLSKALTKNLIVLVLGTFINYINASLIHTFSKNQVSQSIKASHKTYVHFGYFARVIMS